MNKKFLIWDNAKDAMLSLVLFLMLIGCVNVFSASFVEAESMFKSGYHYLFRYILFAVTGFFIMWYVGYKMDYHSFFRYKGLIYAGMFAALVYVDAFSRSVKGAQRWIILGPISFQPSEFVKLGVLIIGASYLGKLMEKGRKPHLYKMDVNQAFLGALLLAALVYKQPDMGTAAIILALMLVLYFVAGMPGKEMAAVLGLGLGAAALMIIREPYRFNRVKVWFDPWVDPQGAGYQTVQSLVSIGSGGLIGNPLGMGTGKFFYLPEAHTDFAFAIFCQEWGFLGALFLMVLFILLCASMYAIAKETRDRSGFLLVTGANFFLVGQAVANMAMVCGILPVIGVPLTFISYGGTSLWASLIAVGLVISVYRHELKTAQEQQPEPAPRFRPSPGYRVQERRWRP